LLLDNFPYFSSS